MEFSLPFLENFIWTDAGVLIPVLYIIGKALEQTPKVPKWILPWVLIFTGVTFCLINYGLLIQAVVQGILTAGGAVLLKELIHKQSQIANKDEKEVETKK